VERALERANAKVVSKSMRSADLHTRLQAGRGRPGGVLTLVSPEELVSLELSPAKLLDGAWDGLSQKVRGWVKDHLVSRGRDALAADDVAALAASNLVNALDSLLASSLHSPPSIGPNGLRVPDRLVTEVLRRAGV
jgi:hypothetical protein